MLQLQDAARQILKNNPLKFYALVGNEYGIKAQYIRHLTKYYGDKVECATVSDVLRLMRTKHIIPLKPCLYVVRYDETFISELSKSIEIEISKTNIIGTLICIYENSKHVNKLEKYIPQYTVHIDGVGKQHIQKYLSNDFPNIDKDTISNVVKYADNYMQAYNMCIGIAELPDSKLSESDVIQLFGCSYTSTDDQIKKCVGARNFSEFIKLIDNYDDTLDKVLYSILSCMVELDKIKDNKYIQSDMRGYDKYWTREDVYYMFMNTYSELKRLRSLSSYDMKNSLIYLAGLLKFQHIPSPEAMK